MGGDRGGRAGGVGRQAEMAQDAPCDCPRVDHSEQPEPSAASWTLQHVEPKRPLHQPRPQSVRARPAARVDRWRRCRRCPGRLVGGRLVERRGRGGRGDTCGLSGARQTRPPGSMRREHSVSAVQDQVDPRPRRQRCQSFQQFQRMEAQVSRPVAPAIAQLQQHVSLARQADPVVRNRGAERVPAHPFQLRPVARGREDAGVEVEPAVRGVTRPRSIGSGGSSGRLLQRRTSLPALGPKTSRPCTDAAASPASTGAAAATGRPRPTPRAPFRRRVGSATARCAARSS